MQLKLKTVKSLSIYVTERANVATQDSEKGCFRFRSSPLVKHLLLVWFTHLVKIILGYIFFLN